jgi:hypothetical protein
VKLRRGHRPEYGDDDRAAPADTGRTGGRNDSGGSRRGADGVRGDARGLGCAAAELGAAAARGARQRPVEQTTALSFRLDQLDTADDLGGELVLRFEENDGIAKLARLTSNGVDVELFHILTFT